MNVFRSVIVASLLGGCVLISGCKATVSAGINCTLPAWICTPFGKITGSPFHPFTDDGNQSIVQTLDASQFYISTAGSTIAYPGTGDVTISLLSSGGALEAAKTFPWVRNGTLITLEDPSVVDAWAENAAPSATQLKYSLVPFSVASQLQLGSNTVEQSSYYQASKLATASEVITCTATARHGPPSRYKRISSCY